MKLELCHYNDGKCKSDSHECYFQDKDQMTRSSITDITGYGKTKEEAIEDMRRQLADLFKELYAVEKMIFGTSYYDENCAEVDWKGDYINE